MNTSQFDHNLSFNNSSVNINFFTDKPNLSKIEEFDDNKYIKDLIRGYELIRTFSLDGALLVFKTMLTETQSIDKSEKTSECLINIGIIYFYEGKLSKSNYYLLEAYKLFKERTLSTISLNLQKVRLLSNLIIVSIAINNIESSLEYNEELIEHMSNSIKNYDLSYRKTIFNQAVKSFFFFPDIYSKKFNFDKVFEKYDQFQCGNNIFLKCKSFTSIVMGFMKYIQNEKNLDYFSRCLIEAINNLKILKDNHTLSLSLLCLSLLKIKNEEVKNSKIVAMDCFKLLKLNKNFELIYTKLINEQYQKFETCRTIYNSMNNFYVENIEKYPNITFKTLFNYDQENKNKRSYIISILNKIKREICLSKNQINDSFQEIDLDLLLRNIEFSLEIIYKNEGGIEGILNYLQVDGIIKNYFENIGNNLMFIINRERKKKYFKRFFVMCLGFDEVKKYREYAKKEILEPKLKNFNEKSFELLEFGISLYKFNFSSFGKKERFLKYDRFVNNFVIGKDNKFKKRSCINIPMEEVLEITLGVKSRNLKATFHKLKKDFFKKSWRYVSVITNSRSYDFYNDKDEDILKLYYAFIYVKETKNSNFKILSRKDFSLIRLKLKLIQAVELYFEKNFMEKHRYFGSFLKSDNFKNSAYFINVSWSLVKLLIFCKKNKIKIKE